MKRYIWIILAVLALLAVFSIQSDRSTEQVPTATQLDSELRIFSLTTSWPLPYRTIPTGAPNRPDLPPAPPVPQVLFGHWQEPAFQSVLGQTLTARADWLFDHYPVDWLRQEFASLLRTHQLGVRFKQVSRTGAAFEATAGPHSGGSAYLVLYIGGLLAAKTDEDFLEIFLSMHHEFLHYRRWLNSTPEEDAVVTDPVRHIADYCQFKWEDERDTILRTCPLNIKWGMTQDTKATCLHSDNVAEFDQAYFILILMQRERIGLDAIPGGRLCLQRWAMIAGHPHPDEFKN